MHGVVGDFERHLVHAPPVGAPRLVALLGGTLGNFLPGARRSFLRSLSRTLGADGHLLLGTDLVKDVEVLEAAYGVQPQTRRVASYTDAQRMFGFTVARAA